MNPSILDEIGNTPLVEIRRLNPNRGVKILAKLEYMNPGGSIKDRAALSMIEAGEHSGELTPGKTVIEATSGNTGIGLAMVCTVKGYPLLLAMSEAVSSERQMILKARGAKLLLTPGHLGTDGAIEEVYRLVREAPGRYFLTDQFNNPANWQAHYNGTAVELWAQTGGQLDAVVATLGTAGSLMGLSRRLKEYNPDLRIVGVEPYLGHKIQGLKNLKEAYRPEIFDKKRLDEKINVDDEDAFTTTRRLAREEGIFVGMSSGAAVFVACRLAERMESGTIAVILPDGGERYLSTPLFTVRDKVGLKLYNTLGRAKENFEPLQTGRVSIYSCGPTVHARSHLGECRRYIFSDLLVRYLKFRGYQATHVMNITDYDDKTIAGSEKAGQELKDFTDENVAAFRADLEMLGIEPADHYPRASEHVDDMVSVAVKLARKGYAYEKLRSLYFDISRCRDYGRLSGVDLDKIRVGATVDLDDYEKDNPRDFTLLKRARLSELKRGLYSHTEWGNVRPSWHLQCVAMTMKYLGETYDIHTASRDLVFPHHENEIAIAHALTGQPLARFWIHCDSVLAQGKPVSRKGNGPTLDDLTRDGFSRTEIRYWLLTTHYRKPLRFSRQRLEAARRAVHRINTCLSSINGYDSGNTAYAEIDQLLYDIRQGFVAAMDDDLNISAAMASLFTQVRHINRLLRDKLIGTQDAARILEVFRSIDQVLNLFEFQAPAASAAVKELESQREAARRSGDWPLADALREQLRSMGVEVKDRALKAKR